ncbi:MAG: hypothetical protein KDE53_14055 [Caldilineaceae bacterium]|nr:hypothetical protein [Caldilineaceae bacterium]MCB0124847.1 hypothetical protein [Caldilineaceae bacterium]
MGPVEVIFGVVAVFITLIGFARTYPKELGTTIIILAAIFVLSFVEERVLNLSDTVQNTLLGGDAEATNLLLSLVFEILFIVAVFASYAGITLDFAGRPAPPPQGPLISLAVGLLNGYLVAGTLWYYQQLFGYPLQSLGLIQLPLTARGQAWVELLPQNLFESPVYWMIPVAVLLIWRVRG